MIATFDFVGGVDLPGELAEPPAWEEQDESDCGLCSRSGADADTGLCRPCLDRVPRAGGCGLGLALVTTLAGDGDPAAPLAHLIACAGCRAFFGMLAAVERAADMETPHAAQLGRTAA